MYLNSLHFIVVCSLGVFMNFDILHISLSVHFHFSRLAMSKVTNGKGKVAKVAKVPRKVTLGNNHQQHVWQFDAVKPDNWFSLGCKITYRAYASPRVVEIVKKPPLQCITRIGQTTGLEAVTLYVQDYPQANTVYLQVL